MAHFFIDEALLAADCVPGSVVGIGGAEARHAVTVSRVRPGEHLQIGNGAGLMLSATVVGAEASLLDPADQEPVRRVRSWIDAGTGAPYAVEVWRSSDAAIFDEESRAGVLFSARAGAILPDRRAEQVEGFGRADAELPRPAREDVAVVWQQARKPGRDDRVGELPVLERHRVGERGRARASPVGVVVGEGEAPGTPLDHLAGAHPIHEHDERARHS